MEYQEFITHVQSLAQSNSREETEGAIRATLETIKELIPSDEAQELAAQLPQELGESLRGKEEKLSQPFHLLEFIERTSQKENIEPTMVVIHVRAVFAVLQNALTPERFSKFHTHFPHDYEELFPVSPITQISA